VLAAYSKIALAKELVDSSLTDEAYFERALRAYFPAQIVERFGDRLDAHPLRREIITTVVVNDLVNRGGTTFVHRAGEETGAPALDIVRAYTIVREVFDFPGLWRRIEALDNQVPTSAQCALYLEARRLQDRATRWFLQNRGGTVDVEAEIGRFRGDVLRARPLVPSMMRGVEVERLEGRTADLESRGVPRELALDVAASLDVYSLLDCVEIARATGTDTEAVTALYFALSERYEVDRMLTRITRLPRNGRWEALARQALRADLYSALAGMAQRCIQAATGVTDPDARIQAWEARNAAGLVRARATLSEIGTQDEFDLATMSVALRVMRTLVEQRTGD